jgi:hypothetical protein
MKKVVRINRPLTDAERALVEEDRAWAEAHKDEILEWARESRTKYEKRKAALRETLRLLKESRQAQGITLPELSRRTGIGKGALSRLENDPAPNPTLRTLHRYAEAINREIVVQLIEPASEAPGVVSRKTRPMSREK